MDLIDSLYSIARQISDGDINEINKLHEKAKNEALTYHTEMKGFKGLYAKLHRGHWFQLALVFLTPFATTYLLSKKQQIMNKANGLNTLQNDFEDLDDDDDFADDLEDRELYEELKAKYGNI